MSATIQKRRATSYVGIGHIVLLVVTLLALLPSRNAEAAFIFTYTGTLTRNGADHAGLEGATFTLTAAFSATPYIDNGAGLPSLLINPDESSFIISGAPLLSSNGAYTFPYDLRMYPTLGGALNVPPSNPTSFNHVTPALRLMALVDQLSGGSGSGATIGQMPVLSDFATSISATKMIALPHNIEYDVINASISTVDSNVVPEPASLLIWATLGLSAIGVARFKGRRRELA